MHRLILTLIVVGIAGCDDEPAIGGNVQGLIEYTYCDGAYAYACAAPPPTCGADELAQPLLAEVSGSCTGWTGECVPCAPTCPQRIYWVGFCGIPQGGAQIPPCPDGSYPATESSCEQCECPGTRFTGDCLPCDEPCEPGVDTTCTDDRSIRLTLGTCNPDGTCTCGAGADLNSVTGKCRIADPATECPAYARDATVSDPPFFCNDSLLWACHISCWEGECTYNPYLYERCDSGCTDPLDGTATCS